MSQSRRHQGCARLSAKRREPAQKKLAAASFITEIRPETQNPIKQRQRRGLCYYRKLWK